MRRGDLDSRISGVLCAVAILVVALGHLANVRVDPVPVPPAPAVVPDVPPAPPEPQSEPAMVIVTDAAGRRIADEAIEKVAAKLAVGQWRVQAIPKAGEVGWLRWLVVSEDGVIPTPPVPPIPPVPVPPDPPPVVSGKRALLIVHETADTTTPISGLLVKLRTGPSFDYLKTKGHTLSILDDDSVNEHGQPSKLVEAWRPHFAGMTLPVLFIIDAQTNQLLRKETIAPTATADNIIERVRETGG